jgi:hypothetical protein
MNRHFTAWFVWGLFGLITLSAIVRLGVNLANQGEGLTLLSVTEDIGWMAFMPAFALVGALIVSRQPRNAIGWLLFGPALAMAIPLGPYINQFTTAPAEPSLLLLLSLWFNLWGWLLLIFPLFFILVLFPTGHPPTPRWRWLILAGLVMCGVFIFMATFADTLGPTDGGTWTVANPLGFLEINLFFVGLWSAGMILITVLSAASLVVRYRRAGLLEREQLKWLLYAGALFAVEYVPLFLLPEQSFLRTLWGSFLPFVLVAFPAAIGIAILRYHLFDIDLIIRKTLVYGALTAVLALVYFGTVTLSQNLFVAATGEQSPVAIVLSTLAIAALFGALRLRIQNAIDRHFYRRKYDAEKTLQDFALRAREETDLDSLTAELLLVVEETLQPAEVSIWIKTAPEPRRKQNGFERKN